MAKGKNRPKAQGTRDPMESLTVRLRSRAAIGDTLRQVQDLRAFDFEPGTRPALSLKGAVASVGATHPPRSRQGPSKIPYQISFSALADTLVCVRRRRRKEVLFAKKKTGKGGQKKARWTPWSKHRC